MKNDKIKTSSGLFEKHFGKGTFAVDLKHPNIESFFSDLNKQCLKEDKLRKGERNGNVNIARI